MTTLLENPLPIYAAGAILLTLAGLAFYSRRNAASLAGLALVFAATVAMLLIEQLVVTDREKIRQTLTDALEAVEKNDLTGVLSAIDPAAKNVRQDAEELMKMVEVRQAGASSIRITVDGIHGQSRFRGVLSGTSVKGGMAFAFFDDVDLTWIRKGDRWLIDGYTAYMKGTPIKALQSARSRRPVRAQ